MGVNRSLNQPSSSAGRERVIDLDVTRAVALIGVAAMNYHGALINLGGPIGESRINRFFNPWTGPLSTRFAATFVLVAGMGITLLTDRGRLSGDRARRSADRWTLVRRGVLLYAFGFVFEWVWSGTILFFYGAFFVAGALLFTLRTRWLVVVGTAAALGAAALQWWAFDSHHDTSWLFTDWYAPGRYRSPRRLLFDTFVNGTHPLLPWLAFLCAGMIIGRHLPLVAPWRRVLGTLGVMLIAGTYLAKYIFDNTAVAVAPVRHRSIQPQPQLHDLRPRLVDHRLLRHRLDRREDQGQRGDQGVRGRRTHHTDVVHPPRVRVQRRRHTVAPHPSSRSRCRPGIRRRVLDRGNHRGGVVAATIRHRTGRVGLPQVRRQQHAGHGHAARHAARARTNHTDGHTDSHATGHSTSLNVSH